MNKTNNNNNKITIKMLRQLAKEVMLKFTKKEYYKILLEFKIIEKKLKILKSINTNNIEILNYPFFIIKNFLRNDDIINNNITNENILNNAPKFENNYIIINQVINHEN